MKESNYQEEDVSIIRGYSIYDGLPKELEISNGRIKRITTKRRMESDTYSDQYIAPGLIDNQINGYLGVDFTGPGLTVDKVREVTRALWKVGVTTYFPTLITSSYENLLENFSILAAAVRDSEIGQSIPGFHLEGPYISPEDGYRGAHPREWVRAPDWKEFEQLYAAGDRKISQVTLAPEQPGSLDFIRVARSSGIVIALGHHNASPQIIRDAVEAGAAISTHLGNGCANMIHRHDNPLWTQLAEDRLMASIIVDGIHLRPEEVQTFYKVKGTDGILLTSDVTHLAGLQPGSYSINGRDVVLTSDGMIKFPEQNVLAGSAVPLHRCVANMTQITSCTPAEAITMASTNPAKLYGLSDRGVLKVGTRADLIVFTLGANNSMAIEQTIIAGRCVYNAAQRAENVS